MKSLIKKYILYIGIKYLVYYLWNFGTSILEWNYSNISGVIHGAITLSILPIIEMAFLSIPTIWLIQQSSMNKRWTPILTVIFIVEFLLTVWMTQNKILEHHYVKLIISVSTFCILFLPEIIRKNKEKTAHNNG